ncbi:MAG TPA: hypothetical protein DD473_26640 [Planctomycetaceae bacterium]|nr:hypothetical protein [Planctomycetaceae bacterium]
MEGIITIIILVITAIGWISNAMNEQKNKPRPGQKPQQRPRRKLQSEIENFLKEVQQQQGPEKAKPQPPQQRPAERPPLVEERPSVLRQQDSPPTRPQFQAKAQEKPQRRKEKRKKPNVNKSVSQPLAHLNPTAALPDSFNRHKDKAKPRESVFVVPKKAEYKKPASKGNFVALLHVPGNVQNAIIMSEILQPPLALRNRKSSR